MSLTDILAGFKANALQCDRLIANAHQTGTTGAALLPVLDQHQITVAAFLNLFVSWETFLEESIVSLMAGSPTISGRPPVRFVSPPTVEDARRLVIGVNRYFDYGNHENVRKIVKMFFENGYPFEPHLGSIYTTLGDLRTMRNASAHITSTTQAALEALAQRIFSTPRPGIRLYELLTTVDPMSSSGNTVYSESREKLLIVANLIANG